MAILAVGEKLHIIERRLFLGDLRRHFVGEVLDCVDNAVRVRGYAWVFDGEKSFVRKPSELGRMLWACTASMSTEVVQLISETSSE